MDKQNSSISKKGFLLVVEGLDGSGKSTLINNLYNTLQKEKYPVKVSRWRGSPVIGRYIDQIQSRKAILSPLGFSLLHAADFADRIEREIKPALEKGNIVICDRYFQTEIARDFAFGIDPNWSDKLYPYAIKPDMVLYLDIPLNTSTSRVLKRLKRGVIQSNAKQDMHGTILGTLNNVQNVNLHSAYQPSGEPMNEQYKKKIQSEFQAKVLKKYESFITKYKMIRINATFPSKIVAKQIYDLLIQKIYKKNLPN